MKEIITNDKMEGFRWENKDVMMQDNPKNELMTTEELAEYLRVDRVSIYRYIKQGDIPALRVGGRWRFKKDDIEDWLLTQAEEEVRNPKEILVVDDEELVRNMLRDILTHNGYEVSLTASGSEALKYLENKEPQLIILDLEMPEMSGIEVLSEVRDLSKDLPVVLFTGNLTAEAAVQAVKLGVNGYVPKPLEGIDDFIQKIEEVTTKKPSIVDLEQLQEKISDLEKMIMSYKGLGIYTSAYFNQRLSEEIKRAERYSSLLSLAMLNVKFTNERGTNGNGDLKYFELQELSKLTLNSFRETDVIGLADKNMIGIILTETDESGAKAATQRITNQIDDLLFTDEECEINVGTASYPTQADSASELLEKSIAALYMVEQT